jgi:hypothetical protein
MSDDQKNLADEAVAKNPDMMRRVTIWTVLYHALREDGTGFVCGLSLFDWCQEALKKSDAMFEDTQHFRAFIAGMIDAGTVAESFGKSAIAKLEDSSFNLSLEQATFAGMVLDIDRGTIPPRTIPPQGGAL